MERLGHSATYDAGTELGYAMLMRMLSLWILWLGHKLMVVVFLESEQLSNSFAIKNTAFLIVFVSIPGELGTPIS